MSKVLGRERGRHDRAAVVAGTDDLETIKMRWRYAGVLSQQNEGNHTEAVATLEDVVRRCRRILGNQHPLTARAQNMLELSRRRDY